jgi:uncharacterized protein (DUF305 family)
MNRRCNVAALALLSVLACATHPQPSQNVTPVAQARGPAVRVPVPPPPAPPPRDTAAKDYTAADVEFMQGMIAHHAQAIQMARWAPSHGASNGVQGLCARIAVGQQDEIRAMDRWLSDRGLYVPPADPRGHVMPGMSQPMLMPGMLTPEQMAQLDAARGTQFDSLFLVFMIQHHRGAITMVQQLLAVPGAAENGPVFRFANDVNVDQTTEINRMTQMLDALKRSSQ